MTTVSTDILQRFFCGVAATFSGALVTTSRVMVFHETSTDKNCIIFFIGFLKSSENFGAPAVKFACPQFANILLI
jgi:hypothetical protein